MKLLKNIYDNFEEYAAVLFLAIMIVCLIIQVIARAVYGSSVAWTEELSRFTFIWAVYIGMALATKRGSQVRITAQFLRFSTNGRLFFRILGDIIWIAGSLYVAFEGIKVIEENLMFPENSPTMPFIVKAWVEAIIPFTFIIMPLRILEIYYVNIKKGTLASLVNYEDEVA